MTLLQTGSKILRTFWTWIWRNPCVHHPDGFYSQVCTDLPSLLSFTLTSGTRLFVFFVPVKSRLVNPVSLTVCLSLLFVSCCQRRLPPLSSLIGIMVCMLGVTGRISCARGLNWNYNRLHLRGDLHLEVGVLQKTRWKTKTLSVSLSVFYFIFHRPWVKPRGHQFTDNNHQQPHRWGLSEKNGAITTAGQDLGFLLLLFNCQNMFPVFLFFFSVFFNNEPPVLKFFFFSFIFCC